MSFPDHHHPVLQSLNTKKAHAHANNNLINLVHSPSLNWEWERGSPSSNVLANSVDLLNFTTGNLSLEVLKLVIRLWKSSLNLLANLDSVVNIFGDLLEVLGAEATGSHGWGTDTDTVGGKRRLVTWDGVLVASNINLLKNSLNTGTIKSLWTEVEENHVGVGSVRDELVAKLLELLLEGLGVLDNLLLVLLELWGGSLLEGNSQGSDGVVVWATLVTWEDGEVDLVLKIVHDVLARLVLGADTLAEEDHGTTWATERLMSGSGDDVGILEWGWNDTGGDEAGDVSHVNDEVSTDGVGNLAHLLVINQTAVGGGTGNENLWPVHLGVCSELLVVDDTGVNVDTVWKGLEVGRDGRDLAVGGLVTVGQMPSVWEIKTHESLMRSHDGLVDLEVGWGAGETLNVNTPLGWVQVECLKGASLAGQLNGINVLVATVVSSTWITLRVFVGHWGSKGIEDGAGGDVLRGDEDDGLALSLDLLLLVKLLALLADMMLRLSTYHDSSDLWVSLQ